MNALSGRHRQLAYGVAILLMFVAMRYYAFGLETRKQRVDLGEATIGQGDTGSFVLQLMLLGGARGVAANVFWLQALDLQKAHEWDQLRMKVDLITKLQPHFRSIWTFQGWNLAYNVSVEWDAPEDKYDWIKQGIKFLQEGYRKNPEVPDLASDTAFTYYHKLGFADEAIVLRRLFRDDEDEPFRREPIEGILKNDNFLLAHGWFNESVRVADAQQRGRAVTSTSIEFVDKPVQHKGTPDQIAFYAMPAYGVTRYAIALEKASVLDEEATFGEHARIAWQRARDEWVKFGLRRFKAWNDPENRDVQLDDVTDPKRFDRLTKTQQYWTNRWSNDYNYRHWKDRARAEMEPDGVRARQHFYEGTKALRAGRFIAEGDQPGAADHYRDGLAIWGKLLSRYPFFRNDDLNKQETGRIVKRYVLALKNAGQEPPKDTPFLELLEAAMVDTSVDPYDQLEVRTKSRRGSGAATP